MQYIYNDIIGSTRQIIVINFITSLSNIVSLLLLYDCMVYTNIVFSNKLGKKAISSTVFVKRFYE